MIERLLKKLNLINIDANNIDFGLSLDKNSSLLVGDFKKGTFKNTEEWSLFIEPFFNLMSENFPNIKFITIRVKENLENAKYIFNLLFNLNFKRKNYEIYYEKDMMIMDLKENVNSKYDKEVILKMLHFLNIPNDAFDFKIQEADYELPKNKKRYQNYNTRLENVERLEIDELPITEEMVNSFRASPNIIGKICFMDSKTTTKGIVYTYHLTNLKETVIAKVFSKTTLDYKVGDTVEATGKMEYDSLYSKQVIFKVVNIKNASQEINDEKLDCLENEEERVELHAHSNMDTQDAIPSVEEYYENAKKLGIKAISICNKENVQNFFAVEESAKEYNMKPIYSVELKVVDDKNYKIFHERGEFDGNVLVGLDIETTGLSNCFDEIIEISAFKIIDNQIYEYSKLIKLDDYNIDKLSNKTTELTSITDEMLKEEGISIKDALKGLIDFIGDGVIVAHNADFDVYFLEEKIKKYLGITKNFSYIDTLVMARNILNDIKSYTLDKVASKLKINLEQHHRAIYDAKCCLDIFYKLMALISRTEVELIPSNVEEKVYISIRTTTEKALNSIKAIDFAKIVHQEKDETKKACYETVFEFNHKDIEKFINLDIKSMKIENIYKENKLYFDNLETLNSLLGLNDYLKVRPLHIQVIVKNQKGLKELYKIISLSHTKRITNKGIIVLLSDLDNKDFRDNVLIGSCCSSGIFKQIYLQGFKNTLPLKYFDFIEIQPIKAYYNVDDSITDERIKSTTSKIMLKANDNNIPVVFDTDAHYLHNSDYELREALVETNMSGGVTHPHRFAYRLGENKMYSTSRLIEVMSKDYSLLEEETRKYVIDNPNKILDMIDDNIRITPDKLYIPTETFLKGKKLDVLEGRNVDNIAKEFDRLINLGLDKYRINGKLPEYIENRAKREIEPIKKYGYHIIYYISYLLVKKSLMDGYTVGSRGSVGSSFVANLMGITEVNALKPHYRCPKCNYQIYKDVESFVKIDSTKEKILRDNLNKVSSGFDLEEENCPCCNTKMVRDGHDIPFETFLGFDGDKVPDIDLNFASVYQAKAHLFTKELFGEHNVVRAGTVSKFAEKTAFNILKDRYEGQLSDAEILRRSSKLLNIKRTTGQHASGIIIIPEGMEYEDFTPVQYPANDKEAWLTTHYDYSSIHDNLLKLDILGHVDPTMLKELMEEVKKNPSEYPFKTIQEIPFCDKKVFSLLKKDANNIINALGISEFGTKFVMGILNDVEIKTFADLVKVSGLSHGTDVWQNNAKDLVTNASKFGEIPFEKVIGCRDDIMVQLISYGLESKDAFDIMEFVRKGKVAKNKEKWEKYKEILTSHNVPEWYIWSCERIKYMFPKAHAIAYVISALRIAWFKAYKPLVFYKVYMSVRDKKFDTKTIITNDKDIIRREIESINKSKTSKISDFDKIPMLEMAIEILDKGYEFVAPNINKSHSTKFITEDDKKLIIPFNKLDGVGDELANSVYNNRENVSYADIEDLKNRGKANKKFIDAMNDIDNLKFN